MRAVLPILAILAVLFLTPWASAQITTDPATLEESVEAGQVTLQTLTLQNTGDAPVSFDLEVRSNGAVRRPAHRVLPAAPVRPGVPAGLHRYRSELQPTGPPLTSAPQRQGAREGGSGRLFGVDFVSDQIVEIDPVTGTVVNTFAAPTPVSGGPEGLAFDGEALYYLASFDNAAIYKLDVETGAVLGTSVPVEAGGMDALAHSGEALYGLNYGEGIVYEIDFDAGIVVGSVSLPGAAGGMSFGGARGTLFVTIGFSEIAEIDPADGTVLNTISNPEFGSFYGLGYSNGLDLLFGQDIGAGLIRALDPDTGSEVYSFAASTISGVAADEAAGVSWLAVEPGAGTIKASETTAIEVTFDATSLFAGTYEAVIDVVVDDQVAASVPVTLTVTGEPEIVVAPPALDFGLVFVGSEAEASVTVSNAGTATLNVGAITVSDPAFSVDADGLVLDPLDSATLTVTFSPGTKGTVNAELALTSDDASDPSVMVGLTGEGALPPIVNVEPGALSAEAESGDVATQTLTLSNTGSSPLTYTVTAQQAAATQQATPQGSVLRTPEGHAYRRATSSRGLTRPPLERGSVKHVFGIDRRAHPGAHRSLTAEEPLRAGTLPTLATDPVGDGGMADLVAIRGLFTPDEVTVEFEFEAPVDLSSFLAFIGFDADQDPSTGQDFSVIIDAALGVEFGVVVQDGGGGPEALLVDYVAGEVLAFAPAVEDGSTLRISFPGGLITGLSDGANAVGLTVDDQSGTVVDVVPDSGFFIVREGVPWLGVTPEAGTVEAGASEELTVTFDAGELFAGTYEALLLVDSNDPATPTVTVPVTFDVSGAPELDVPSELDFGTVFVDFPTTRILLVENEGTDSLTVEIESSDAALAAIPSSFTVPPASAEPVAVTVTPEEAGAFAFTLSLATNDADEPSVVVGVTGTATEAPVGEVDPGAFVFEVEAGGTASAALTISNAGGSPLAFEISAQRAALRPGPPSRTAEARTWGATGVPLARSGTRMLTGMGGVTGTGGISHRGELPVIYEDAAGDAGVPDLLAVRGLVTSTDLTLQLEVDGALNANDFAGVIGLDIDEDPSTGIPLPFGLPEQSVGIEFGIDLFEVGLGEVVVFDEFFNFVGAYVAVAEGSTLTFSIPLADLADDGSLTFAGVIGDNGGPTDWFPESGAVAVGNVAFLSFSPEAGTVAAGESGEVTVTVDASELNVGTYGAELVVATNDPASPTVIVLVTVVVGVAEDGESDAVPAVFALRTPYPNPVRGRATITFDLPRAASVRLEVYDLQGRQVATLVDGERTPGRHALAFDATGLSSGVYFVRLTTGTFVATHKAVVLK